MYEPLLPGCHHIPAPFPYRNPFTESDPAKLAPLCLAALEDEIAFQGAGGVIAPHASFMPGVAAPCRKNGILLIADEGITAFGRTGAWSGSRLWRVQRDFLRTAKAIANGYFPFGAVMIAGHVAEVFETDTTGKAAIGHGYTCPGHPVGAVAAIACLAETRRLNVVANAAGRGAQLWEGIKALKDRHSVIGDVRGGHGLMLALELVGDRAPRPHPTRSFQARCREPPIRPGDGAGVRPQHHPVSPLVLNEVDAQVIPEALEAGLAAL